MVLKLRLSYSLLNLWKMGKYQEAVDSYLHRRQLTSQAIEDGRAWDKYAQDYIAKFNRTPKEFLDIPLNKPECQKTIIVPYNEIFDLKCVLDLYDEPILHEYKTGSSKDSGDYVNDFQVAMYFLGAELAQIPMEKGYIIHYNQHTKTTDSSLVWNCKEERERARNTIDSLGPEIFDYFQKEGILEMRLDIEKNIAYNRA